LMKVKQVLKDVSKLQIILIHGLFVNKKKMRKKNGFVKF
jgi:hypothetical protein